MSALAHLLVAATIMVAAAGTAVAEDDCKAVKTQTGFNLAAYAAKPWYIQQQMATTYLPATEDYCVSAQYQILPKPTLLGYSVQVHNIAQEKDGTVHDSGDKICAYSADAQDAAKLAVAPCLLPKVAAGPYWVLEYDESEGYSLISGGQPTHKGTDGCRTGTGVNDAGLWIFTRQQQRNDELVQKVRELAKNQGFDLSVLNDVNQTSCKPVGATLDEHTVAAAIVV